MMNTPLILTYQDKTPRIHSSAWIAPGAVIIGDVEIGADSSVFYGSVLRGDVAPIRIGQRTNIQDNSTVHVDRGVPTILGDDVTDEDALKRLEPGDLGVHIGKGKTAADFTVSDVWEAAEVLARLAELRTGYVIGSGR